MANTLAYYDMATIPAVKSFIVQAPEVSRMKRREPKGRKFVGIFFTKKLVGCDLQKFL